ncbi:hypothetical protein ICW40_13770 [Actinotalea ferrariae]|nr:hypothetical protein [Actinotalea ferrariae]
MTVLVGLAGLVLSAVGGWPLTAGVLRLAAKSPDSGPAGTAPDGTALATSPGAGASGGGADPGAAAPDATAPDATVSGPDDDAGLRGGTWIGILERLAITGSLVAGYPAGIAFVIAVKGLGRYPEIREHPSTSERFVIGTFASMLWAVLVGVAMRQVLEL